MEIRKILGTALANGQTKEIIYTPPQGEQLLREKLANWEVFLNENSDIDPLIRMAIGHYQFEAIHPFADGNGRTGRVLNILYLVQQNLLTLPVLYLSKYIMQKRNDYYRLLQSVTSSSEWEEWILFMLKAVEETASWTTKKIEEVKNLFKKISMHVKENKPSIYSHELIEIIFVQPYCRIQNLIDEKIAKRQTASHYLLELTELGILEEVQRGREKIFINLKLMQILIKDDK